MTIDVRSEDNFFVNMVRAIQEVGLNFVLQFSQFLSLVVYTQNYFKKEIGLTFARLGISKFVQAQAIPRRQKDLK